MTVPGTRMAVPVARHWVRLVLDAAGCPVVDDALVMATELVANAVRHTRSGHPGGHLTVLIGYRGDGTARIEVIDEGAATVPAPREPDHETPDESGRGLWLVQALSREWGVRLLRGDRRGVWVLVPMTVKQGHS
ncbi:ATP-binding protein [Microtetraspora sp. NBRC 13810]|nr:ATP-binding protein [Microtetraspora sp. NBRC 13810]